MNLRTRIHRLEKVGSRNGVVLSFYGPDGNLVHIATDMTLEELVRESHRPGEPTP